MARRSFVQIDGKLYERGVDAIPEAQGDSFPAIIGDIQPFVSPIDGTVLGSRRDLREHCARHNVVLTADLQGLPPKMANMPYELSQQQKQERKEQIIHQVNQKLRRN
jgi:hypothetical protein